ncbi:glycosyltransferase [Paenilisteria rocourtiae]|uniref:Glycosyltransferase involved in cell wall biosynthesis n=1 Tax=Listeria rocourtiae TaxID=647910 RepID=A0A4R6ZQX7_9LIST|nr:glycosyltransferase [Listeria rocourtiae]EUJ45770.1 glycosyl transferase group 1 protein [Listeria rocourtiae FSL F6-920]TDR54549.1 glycosyltransferase involved in cell wall biosynthesis [Listeria rocourtiae]
MKQKITMLLFNNFTNDARVYKEGKALSGAGYQVDLICIQEAGKAMLPHKEEVQQGFQVTRINGRKGMICILSLLIAILVLGLVSGKLIATILSALCLVSLVIPKVRRMLHMASLIVEMTGVARCRKPDFYHAHDLNTLPQAHIAAKFRMKQKALIYDSHEVQTSREGYHGSIHGFIEALYIKTVDFMIVENDTRAKYNEKIYGFLPEVLHNYPELDVTPTKTTSLHEELNLPQDEHILLYQGVINPGRGLEKLVAAAPFFKKGTLVFIGNGRQKSELETLVAKKSLNHKVKFVPQVPLANLKSYTEQAYLGFQVLNNTCFNHYSASSNKLFEYIAAGVPIVACDFPEIKKVVQGDKVGLCVDSHDPMSIADGVNAIMENAHQYNQFKTNITAIKEKYIWENEQHRLLGYYTKLGGESHRKQTN